MTRRLSSNWAWGKIAHFAIGLGLVAVYSIEVCPFIEVLPRASLYAIFGATFVIMVLLDRAWSHYVASNLRASRNPVRNPTLLQLLVDAVLWVGAGVGIAVWNKLRYGFPVLASGGRVIIAFVAIGILASVYGNLRRETGLLANIEISRSRPSIGNELFFSISKKIFALFLCVGVTVTAVMLLLIAKDFALLTESDAATQSVMFEEIMLEVLFVTVIVFVYVFLIVYQYMKNIDLLFRFQLRALRSVRNEEYEDFVPIVNHDEFGVIADQTNEMILGLKEKAKIKRIFGKYVDPQIANSILHRSKDVDLGGEEKEVATLFTDLRGYTVLSESMRPTELVTLLNSYFSIVVETVSRHGGILDKFIGDAAMAVFGLDGAPPFDRAVECGLEIRERLARFNAQRQQAGLPIVDNGIGIHFGPVVAGHIGSEHRLEYTVIGDSVNVAARLEGLTKDLDSPLAISEPIYERLSAGLKARLVPLGVFPLKGKTQKLAVYGLRNIA